MPWINLEHHCGLPHWIDVKNDGATAGSQWMCPDCERVWEFVSFGASYSQKGEPQALEWREVTGTAT